MIFIRMKFVSFRAPPLLNCYCRLALILRWVQLKHFISLSALLGVGCGQSKEHSSAHHRDLQEDCVWLPHSARHRDGSPRGWGSHWFSQRGWTNTPGGGNHRGRRDHSQVTGGHVTQVSRSSVHQKIQHQLHWPGTEENLQSFLTLAVYFSGS